MCMNFSMNVRCVWTLQFIAIDMCLWLLKCMAVECGSWDVLTDIHCNGHTHIAKEINCNGHKFQMPQTHFKCHTLQRTRSYCHWKKIKWPYITKDTHIITYHSGTSTLIIILFNTLIILLGVKALYNGVHFYNIYVKEIW